VKPQLFYHLSDPGGAAARRAVIERGLLEAFQFRNLYYEEVRVDLENHHLAAGRTGSPTLPALWDGKTLYEGKDDVIAAITSIAATLPQP
jgi:hypothetical protein